MPAAQRSEDVAHWRHMDITYSCLYRPWSNMQAFWLGPAVMYIGWRA